VRFGVSLASITTTDVPIARCLEVARAVDSLGYDSLWVDDHVAVPTGSITSEDSQHHDGHERVAGRVGNYEALTLLSALAAMTTSVEIGTAALGLPFRHPAITAKMSSAADLISGGRVVLGVGTGWLPGEFAALGLAEGAYDQRDTITDEYLLAVKEMWLSTGPSNFTGEHLSFRDVGTFPKPHRRPHPPIIVAGHGPEAMVRASRHGNGYLTTAVSPDELAELVEQLRAVCRGDRRDPSEVEVHMLAPVAISEQPTGADRDLLTGSADQIATDLRRYGQAGLDHLILLPANDGTTERHRSMLTTITSFATEILPAFSSPVSARRATTVTAGR
jgi:probable F420-dependent oxidoreductase